MRRGFMPLGMLVAGTTATWGLAQQLPAPSASAPSASASASAPAPARPAPKVWQSCSEYVPKGAVRPKLEAHLPSRGTSGYEARLTVVVTHGAGETVLPEGFRVHRGSDAMKAIEEAKFVLPDPDGGSPVTVDRPAEGAGKTVTTTLSVPFVPLPDKPGRSRLVLPPIPIAVGRANGQVMTLCTGPQAIVIEDPIANEPDPKVKPNPPPRPQREDWPAARVVTYAGLGAIALALLGAYLLSRWRRRPKIEKPKPKIPPWVAAMRELDGIRASTLLDDEEFEEYVDRVNDCVRRYLGDRYGFDGIESTSEEIRATLKRVYPPIRDLGAIGRFLDDTDLVKFAKVSAQREECEQALGRAEQIIRATMPTVSADAGPQERAA